MDSDEVQCVPLLVMDGTFNGNPARVLKDEGCTSNFVSRECASANKHLLRFTPVLIDVNHSKQDANGIATEVIDHGKVQMGSNCYSGNWIVVDSHYEVLLGMPWHTEEHPVADSDRRTVQVRKHLLSGSHLAR